MKMFLIFCLGYAFLIILLMKIIIKILEYYINKESKKVHPLGDYLSKDKDKNHTD